MQPCLHALQTRLLLPHPLRQFFLSLTQKPAQLLQGQLLVQEKNDLVKRETQVFERDDAVCAWQLFQRVVAITAEVVHEHRPEQPHLIVMAQHLDRDATHLCKDTDFEHRSSLDVLLSEEYSLKRLMERAYTLP